MTEVKDWANYSAGLKARGKELGQLHPDIVKGFVALGCIDAHARKAKAAGATKEEIAEALGVAIALNAGAAYTYALHVLDAVGD